MLPELLVIRSLNMLIISDRSSRDVNRVMSGRISRDVSHK
jgi:hypothetical protein